MQNPPCDIAILSPLLHRVSEYGGGITPWVLNLANTMHQRGLYVELLVNAQRGVALAHEQLSPDVPIIDLGYHRWQAWLGLVGYLRRVRPRVLLAASYRYNDLAIGAQRWSGTPTRVYPSVHENVSAASEGLAPGRKYQRLRRMQRRYAQADGVIAVSQGVAQDLIDAIGLPSTRVHTLYNPVIPDDLEMRMAEPVSHPWLTAPAGPILLAVGRLEIQKDFPTLLRAFAHVLLEKPCRLLILGEGRERVALQSLAQALGISERVSLLGHVANPYAYMARCQVLVLSSRWEGFGNVIAEALAVGLPVVATDCPSGPREILADGAYGTLVPPGDAQALAQAILATLAHPPAIAPLKARGACFSVDGCVDEYLRYLKLAAP